MGSLCEGVEYVEGALLWRAVKKNESPNYKVLVTVFRQMSNVYQSKILYISPGTYSV